MNRKHTLVSTLAFCSVLLPLVAVSQDQRKASTPPATQPAASSNHTATHEDGAKDGQRVFEQNCSRCHWSPEGFSPRITGTVARHMRVRAALSEKDYKALMRFLNP